MTENELIKKIAIAKSKPSEFQDLQPGEIADLILVVLKYVKDINQSIQDGQIKGDKGDTPTPDIDYLSLPTARAEINRLREAVTTKLSADVQAITEQVRNGRDGKDGRDGRDAKITKTQIEEAAKIAFSMIELPDFRKYITEQPEAIRDSLELLQGEDRLTWKAIDGLDEIFESLEQKIKTGGTSVISNSNKYLGQLLDIELENVPYSNGKYNLGSANTASIEFIMDGGGMVIPTGIQGDLNIDFNCTIQSWTLLADQSGDVEIDIWKESFANFPPLVADSITGSSLPTLSSGSSANSSILTGWSTTISAGDVLRFNINSISTIERLTLSLKVIKT